MKTCKDCHWHDWFTGACCNGSSYNVAEFMTEDDSCALWQGNPEISTKETTQEKDKY